MVAFIVEGGIMDNNSIVDKAVQEAYINLTSIVKLRITIIGDYFSLIIPESMLKEKENYVDEIVDKTFWKICDEISAKVTKDDMEFITYKSFVNNNPSEELIKDCFDIINNIINKKSSQNTPLFSLLDSLKPKYKKEELNKSLNTIFDILLDYYEIIKK